MLAAEPALTAEPPRHVVAPRDAASPRSAATAENGAAATSDAPSERGLEISVLGPVTVRRRGRPIALGPRRQRFVLAVLALEVNRPVSVDRLVELAWAGDAPRTAGHAIEVCVSGLRSILVAAGVGADEAELHRGPAYRLATEADNVDAHRFSRLVRQIGAGPDEEQVARLTEALALWVGPPLAGSAEPVLAERLCRGLLDARWGAVEDRIEARLRLGEHGRVLAELADLTETHPERERLVTQYLTALYRGGRAIDALDFVRAYRSRLAEQLGLEPGEAVRRLEQAILRHDPVLIGPAARTTPPTAADPAATTDTPSAPAGPPPSARPTPRELPADLPTFVGRRNALDRLAAAAAGTGSGAVIMALSGTAGVGKTTLAVHFAHGAADRFPDGQLYLNLRGFGGGPVLAATVALRQALTALGVAPAQVPLGLDARSALFRSMLAGRRLLVVLDNARDAEHARPLLPGAPGSMALVTSRTSLVGLVVNEGASHLALDVLDPAEARDLLAMRVGGDLVTAHPEPIEEIVARCARLPLALAVAAARMGSDPRRLAEQLRAGSGPLAALDLPEASVEGVLRWSYQALSEPAARLFRLIGCQPGVDLGEAGAASLAGTDLDTTRGRLRELVDANLLTEPLPGRYASHDLLRAYAADRAQEQETEATRLAATRRLVEHYLHTGIAADRLAYPFRLRPPFDPPSAGVCVPDLADGTAAWAWLTAEHANLLAAQKFAGQQSTTEPDWRPLVWQLAWTMSTLLQRQGHPQDLYRTWQAAMAALHHTDPPMLRVTALRNLAEACARMDSFTEAFAHLNRALRLTDEAADAGWGYDGCDTDDRDNNLGRLSNRVELLRTLTRTYSRAGDDRSALREAIRALAASREVGRVDRIASAANAVGWYAARLGDYDTAAVHLNLALGLARDTRDGLLESHTLHSQSYVAQRRGSPAEAVDLLRESLRLARVNGDSYHEATSLRDLGDCHAELGRPDRARDSWQQALPLLEAQSRAAEAAAVRAKLAPPPSQPAS